MTSRSLLLGALAAAGAVLGAGTAAAPASAAGCATVRPTNVKVAPSASGDRVTVTWRARSRSSRLAFRVSRDGAVVGQTRSRRYSVALAPGAKARITVAAVLGSRLTRCRTTVRASGPAAGSRQTPSAVTGMAARPSGRRVVLTWDPAKAGRSPLAGYRVLRNGRTLKRTKARRLTVTPTRRAVRYQVAAYDRKGRLGSRSSVVTVKKGHAAPSAPQGVGYQPASDTRVTLTWAAARAFGSRIAGYRVVRDGVTVKAATGTTLELPATTAPKTYRVVAMDAAGYASAPSAPVVISRPGAGAGATGGRMQRAPAGPPSTPGAPRATAVADTTVTLAWDPATVPTGGALRGYRVMRDGQVVGQVPDPSTTVGNLAPKTAYSWSVAAVDTQGRVSDPSAATTIVQADPPAAEGKVHAFLLASTDASYAAFRNHYRRIGTVYPTFYDCVRPSGAGQGQIEGTNNADIVRFAADRKVRVFARYNCQDPFVLHRIFTEPALRATWINRMVADSVAYGYDGVNVDFEAGFPGDRNLMTSFVSDLSDALHARGKLLSQAVSPKTTDNVNHPRGGIFDYPELSKYNDVVFVMAWGLHWATSDPGAQDPIDWVTQIADYVAAQPRKEKFVMGSMLYGMDWPDGGGLLNEADGRFASEIAQLAARPGATNTYDAATASWHLAYTDDAGRPHDVWYSDPDALALRIQIARQRGLGVGFWRLGQEDERIWSIPTLP